jgi:hypothetical protein
MMRCSVGAKDPGELSSTVCLIRVKNLLIEDQMFFHYARYDDLGSAMRGAAFVESQPIHHCLRKVVSKEKPPF